MTRYRWSYTLDSEGMDGWTGDYETEQEAAAAGLMEAETNGYPGCLVSRMYPAELPELIWGTAVEDIISDAELGEHSIEIFMGMIATDDFVREANKVIASMARVAIGNGWPLEARDHIWHNEGEKP